MPLVLTFLAEFDLTLPALDDHLLQIKSSVLEHLLAINLDVKFANTVDCWTSNQVAVASDNAKISIHNIKLSCVHSKQTLVAGFIHLFSALINRANEVVLVVRDFVVDIINETTSHHFMAAPSDLNKIVGRRVLVTNGTIYQCWCHFFNDLILFNFGLIFN